MSERHSAMFTPRVKGPEQLETSSQLFRSSGLSLLEAHTKPGSSRDPMYGAAARQVLNIMHSLWRQDKLCDVVLVTSDGALKAHKIALGAYSAPLSEKFRRYAATEMIRINVTDFNSATVGTLLQFLYTVEIDINMENIAALLRCAMELGIDIIVQLCREYVEHSNVRTALVCYGVSEMAGWQDLVAKILRLILDNFAELAATDDFLKISAELLAKLIADDTLRVDSELEVFAAVVRWLDHDRRGRIVHTAVLIQHVRLQLVSPDDLATKVEVVDFIFQLLDCQRKLSEAYKFHALHCYGSDLSRSYAGLGPRRPREATTSDESGNTHEQPEVRNSVAHGSLQPSSYDLIERPSKLPRHSTNKSITSSFGVGSVNAGSTERQSKPLRQLTDPTEDPSKMSRHSTNKTITSVVSGNTLLIEHTEPPSTSGCGGGSSMGPDDHLTSSLRCHPLEGRIRIDWNASNNSKAVKDVHPTILCVGGVNLQDIESHMPGRSVIRLHSANEEWTSLTTLDAYTHHHGAAVVHDGRLFVVGGCLYDSAHPEQLGHATNSVNIYDPVEDAWSRGPPMQQSRAYFDLLVDGDVMYAVGGEDRHNKLVETIEQYNYTKNTWSVLTCLRNGGRTGIATAIYHDYLFVVGGYNKDDPQPVLADVDCFDMALLGWTKRSPLSVPRCHANLVVASNHMFLIGGRSRHMQVPSLGSIHVYREQSDTWDYVDDLKVPRHDAGCVVIDSCIFIIGGMMAPCATCLASVECYDVASAEFLPTPDLPVPVAGVACCVMSTG